MDAKSSALAVEPPRWCPELRPDGTVEIYANFFDEGVSRLVSRSITPQEYLLLWDGGLLKFQMQQSPRPEGHPSREEVVAFLEGRLKPVSRKPGYSPPVDPNVVKRRDPPAYAIPGQKSAPEYGDDPEYSDDSERGDDPKYNGGGVADGFLPNDLVSDGDQAPQSGDSTSPGPELDEVETPQHANRRTRTSPQRKLTAFCHAAKKLWEEGGRRDIKIPVNRLVTAAYKEMGGVVKKSTLKVFLYNKITPSNRSLLLRPHKNLSS